MLYHDTSTIVMKEAPKTSQHVVTEPVSSICYFFSQLFRIPKYLLLKSTQHNCVTFLTRYVDGMLTSEVTLVTIQYIHPPHLNLVNIMVMNGWLASFSFLVNRLSHSSDKAISDSDLETPRSRSWVWSKGKGIQWSQCPINLLPFHFTSIRPAIPDIQLFGNLNLKHPRSRSWLRSKTKVTHYTQYPTDALPFCFSSIRPTIPEKWPK